MSNYVYDLPTEGEFYELLNNTIAPNLTFTQCNLFECLEQIFMYLDGYPVLTQDNKLDIRYFNDNNGKIVTSKESDLKMAMSESRFVNGLLTDFQNADLNNVLTYPSKKTYSAIQSKNIGIPKDTDYIMRVDQPIYNLRSVKIWLEEFALYSYTETSLNPKKLTHHIKFNDYVDIINNVLPQDLYINLENSTLTTNLVKTDLYKENCLYWEQKSNEIDVSNKFNIFVFTEYTMSYVIKSSLAKICCNAVDNEKGTMTPDFTDVKNQLKYQIEYETLANGRLLIEGTENKYQGAERLDIGQGASDIMKLGLNLLGTSIKTGVDTLVRTEKFIDPQNKIKVGSIYYENGEKYIATKVDECVFSDFIFQTIEYTKNFNKLSQFIALDQKKRFNEVDSSLTLKSEDVYKEYLYFSLNEVNESLLTDIHLIRNLVYSGINETFKLNPTNDTKIDFVACNTLNYDGSSNEKFGNVWLPLLQYGSANALCFEMSFSAPMNANSNFQYDETLSAWYSKYILYTANDGFADLFNIDFYNQIKEVKTDDLPQITTEMISSTNATKVGGFTNLNYYKKQNETFAMNYELICLPYQNQELFVGERFIKYNGLIGNSVPKMRLKLFISDTEKYSMFDKYALGDEVSGTFNIVLETINAYTNKAQFNLHIYKGNNLYQLDKKIVSWAICDENNNIYLCANEELEINSELNCYIFTSHTRL